jgi:phage shock protein A
MASTGLLARLSNLWRGFLSLWISGAERRNPEIAYQNAIDSMLERYAGLKRATAALVRRREELAHHLAAASRDRALVDRDLETAVDAGDDALALALIAKRRTLDDDIDGTRGELEAAGAEAESAKSSLLQVQTEIRRLKAEKDAMLARLRSAEARIRIQEQLEGLSVDADVRALDNVREHIRTTVAEATLGRELEDASADARLARLRARSAEAAAHEELARLKAARARPALPEKKTV